MTNNEPTLIINEQELTIISAMLRNVDYNLLAHEVYDEHQPAGYVLSDTMLGFVEDVAKLLQTRVCSALNGQGPAFCAHNYFEVAHYDRYTGFITMLDGRRMQFMHVSHDSEEAYLQDITTGEVYPIVRILGDGDTEVFITE